jgi:hypothetical protein
LSGEGTVSVKIFTNVMIFDGSGSDPFSGEALIEGNRIGEVASGHIMSKSSR